MYNRIPTETVTLTNKTSSLQGRIYLRAFWATAVDTMMKKKIDNQGDTAIENTFSTKRRLGTVNAKRDALTHF